MESTEICGLDEIDEKIKSWIEKAIRKMEKLISMEKSMSGEEFLSDCFKKEICFNSFIKAFFKKHHKEFFIPENSKETPQVDLTLTYNNGNEYLLFEIKHISENSSENNALAEHIAKENINNNNGIEFFIHKRKIKEIIPEEMEEIKSSIQSILIKGVANANENNIFSPVLEVEKNGNKVFFNYKKEIAASQLGAYCLHFKGEHPNYSVRGYVLDYAIKDNRIEFRMGKIAVKEPNEVEEVLICWKDGKNKKFKKLPDVRGFLYSCPLRIFKEYP